MGVVGQILSGPFKEVLSGIADVIGKFVQSPEEKAKAELALAQMANDFQLKSMELDKEWAIQQATVITAEAKSESWAARNWRPMIMLMFGFIIGYNYILSPVFGLARLEIVPDMWELLRIGIGGYIMGRSAEKIAPQIVAAIKK